MEEIKNSQIIRMVEGIRMARGPFSDAYDKFARSYRSKRFILIAEEANQTESLPAGPERDQRDFTEALIAARDANWLVEFVFDQYADLSADAPEPARIEMQGIVDRTRRFVDAKTVEGGTIAAARRCCQIVVVTRDAVGQPLVEPLGSGFLVGPHLVLTNYHVVRGLHEAGDGQRPSVRFDFHEGARGLDREEVIECVADWLRASSKAPDPAAAAATLRAGLDYALLEVDGLPGYARGWYDLARMQAPPAPGAPLEVWQFPAGQPMKVLPGPRAQPPDGLGFEALGAEEEVPPRIYYTVNTLKGSSGSLVLDAAAKEPVALHDAGFEPDAGPGPPPRNRGVPLALIAADARERLDQALSNVPAKIGWHASGSLPIIGRRKLQELIFRAHRGDVRIISVLTRPNDSGQRVARLGRSYTRVVLQACLPATDHHVLEFSAARIDPDPLLTAQRLVQTVNAMLVADLPQPSGQTTLDADSMVLVEETVKALMAGVPTKTIWLMIDDIDAHPIGTQWGSAAFLIALYRRAATEPRLRVVLVGLPRELEGLADLGVQAVEHLEAPPSKEELNFWLQAYLAERTWPSEIGPRLGRLIRSVAREQTAADASLLTEKVAGLLSAHAHQAFRGTGDD